MICHDRADLEEQGFLFVREIGLDMPSIGATIKLAREQDVTIRSIGAFRLEGGVWAFFVRPNPVRKYVSEPLLP
jgi:hypothetical protein